MWVLTAVHRSPLGGTVTEPSTPQRSNNESFLRGRFGGAGEFVDVADAGPGTTRFAIKGSNAQSGGLATLWDGALPNGYNPMKEQGAIVAGYPSDTTENSVQANIVAAGYR